MTSADYHRLVVEKLIPALRKHFGYLNRNKPEDQHIHPIIVQDGAPPHRSPKVKEALEREGYRILTDWPGYSPDFYPIENCWGLTKKELNEEISVEKSSTDANKQRLWEEVKAYFDDLDDSYIQTLIESFPALGQFPGRRWMGGLLRKGQYNRCKMIQKRVYFRMKRGKKVNFIA